MQTSKIKTFISVTNLRTAALLQACVVYISHYAEIKIKPVIAVANFQEPHFFSYVSFTLLFIGRHQKSNHLFQYST